MRSGFFNSEIISYDVEGMPVFDRAEDATFFAKYFSQFISNGVFPNPSTNMQVIATTGMQVKVDIGVCYINGYMGWVEIPETFEIEESDLQARIDRIVARLDFTDRSINLFVKKGKSAGNPTAPEVQRDYDIYEIALADIKVNANVVEITQENIIDLRLNTELCGIVANQLQHIDTTTLFNQYQKWLNRVTEEAEDDLTKKKQQIETNFKNLMSSFSNSFENLISNFSNDFDEWFQDLETTLSGDIAGNLFVKINNLENGMNIVNEKIDALDKRARHVYGIKRNIKNSDSSWERIGDNVGLVANATHDGTEIQNDFDNIYPWSDIISYNYSIEEQKITAFYKEPNFKFDGSNGEVMTRIPEFWYKRKQVTEEDGNTYEYIYIADYAADGFNKSEQFSLSRYTASGSESRLYSKSGAKSLVSITPTNFRTYARALGNNWGSLDIWHWSVIQLLYLVEYADYNSQNKLGKGVYLATNTEQAINGDCNSLGMKSGCLINDGVHSMIYRGIENIFGNLFQFCDGVNINNYQAYVCYNPEDYACNVFDGPYHQLEYVNINTSTEYIKKLGYDANNPIIQMPIEGGASSDTYITDDYICESGNNVVYVGGSWYRGWGAGLWHLCCISNTNGYCTCRLLLNK